jgi:hypothetical protein
MPGTLEEREGAESDTHLSQADSGTCMHPITSIHECLLKLLHLGLGKLVLPIGPSVTYGLKIPFLVDWMLVPKLWHCDANAPDENELECHFGTTKVD